MASNVPDLTTPVSVGGCPICDNRSSKDATWAEQFHLTEEKLRDLAKCNEKDMQEQAGRDQVNAHHSHGREQLRASFVAQVTDGLNTFKELVAFLTAQTTSDVERYWVLFHWVQRESRRRHRTSPRPLSEDNPLEFLRAVKACTGSYSYADLYKKLCSTAGLKCETVIGHRKSIGSRTDRSSAQQCKSKSWNLINVDGKRALVDCEFELNFEANRMPPCYFMARPTRFATTHFPQDQSQQLLQVSVTLEQFQCHGHSRCLPSSPRRKTAMKASRATETKEGRRQMSGKPQEGESTEEHDRDPKSEDQGDPRLPKYCNHHIMISYCWSQQTEVRKIKEHLDKVGYRVWFDEIDMKGTLARAMAEAVNDAAIVLIAFSEDYAKSKNCKLESTFAHQQGKQIVPLKMTDYKPDGWLGLVLAGKLYIDFSSTEPFGDKLKKLEVQIEDKLTKLLRSETDSPVKNEPKRAETKEVKQTLGKFRRHGHGRGVPSSPRRKTAIKGSRARVTETKEERRQMSGKPQEEESTEDHDRDQKPEDQGDPRLKPRALPKDCTHHIMISYCQSQQKKVRRIKGHLKKVGYRVWMASFDMKGTLTSSTAEAIKEAAIVLIAFSEDYAQSQICKQEALFAQDQKKGIVPLKMKDYEPDDWLGLLLAGKKHVDFSSKKSFRDKMKQLQQLEDQIEHRLAEIETV